MSPPGPIERWAAVLDELESLLDRQQVAADGHAVDADAIAVLVLAPPDDLPPLPAGLEDRARRLLARTQRLAGEVATAADRIRPRSAAAPPPGRQPSAHLDHRI